ncbi:MAG: hypothetical protein JXB34_05640 [Bacteroidales bacterium]|nr:hypothetical protein [Bacteroidales bacterium]
MQRVFVALLLMLLCGTACKEVEYVSVMPAWLEEKVKLMETDCSYYGSKAVRYNWQAQYIYELSIPIYACGWCNIFYADGNPVAWTDSLNIKHYRANRKNAKVLWSFNDIDCEK